MVLRFVWNMICRGWRGSGQKLLGLEVRIGTKEQVLMASSYATLLWRTRFEVTQLVQAYLRLECLRPLGSSVVCLLQGGWAEARSFFLWSAAMLLFLAE